MNQTFDDIRDADGRGDEVYGAFAAFHFSRKTDQLLDQDLKRTPELGQAGSGAPGRLRGGTASPTGGLRNGDTYPASGSSASAMNQALPLVIWDGFLTDGEDAVIIVPTLWESDGDDSMVTDWFVREKAVAPLFWWDVGLQKALSRLVAHQPGIPIAVPSWVPDGNYGEAQIASDNFMTTFGLTGFGTIIPKDRPIGISLRGSGFELPRRALAITREQIESALNAQLPPTSTADVHTGNKDVEVIQTPQTPGRISVPLIDGPGPTLNGNYVLRLHVERRP